MAMKIRASVLIAALSLAFGALAAAAPDRGEERIWTGTNGSSFRGTYVESMGQGGKIRFFTTAGKIVTVAFGNLSEADQKIIEGFEGKPAAGAAAKKSAFDPDKFKDLPAADRNLMPERKPGDFGGNDDESMVDALWVSLLWWNSFEVMPIPKTGDFDKKAEWLHEELTRHIAPRGRSAASDQETKEGLEKYFSRRLEDIGSCKVSTIEEAVKHDSLLVELVKNDPVIRASGAFICPLILSKLSKGNDIVIIRLGMTYENGKDYVECAAIEHIAEDGAFSMHMYGKRLTGKMAEVPKAKATKPSWDDKLYEFVINNRDSLPKNYVTEGARFFAYKDTSGLVLKPYVYKTPGEPAPLPKD